MGAADILLRLKAAGFRLRVNGEKILIAPASKLTDDLRAELRESKPEVLALLTAPAPQDGLYRLNEVEAGVAHADAWDDAAIARFQARTRHIRRHGFTEQDADDMAERLHLRDVHADYRHLCLECRHYRPRRCGNHRAAGLTTNDLVRDLATMFQDCPGFSEVL